jgi:hypothetical protein
MKQKVAGESFPAYSSNDKLAKQVLSRLRMGKRSVIVGRTDLPGRTSFARYENNSMDGTEVFGDTFALAVCRLALLRVKEGDAAR